jgi:Antitoxin ParD
MKKKNLLLEVSPTDHARIKAWAAGQGKTIKEWVMIAIARQMRIDYERETGHLAHKK